MKIFLPDFLLASQGITLPPLDTQALPALTALLRGKTNPVQAKHSIWAYLDSNDVISMAPITLAHDMPEAPAGFWLRADPVLLRPSLDNLILLPSDGLAITQAEADALVHSLNQLFGENGLTFYAPLPERWYVHCQTFPEVSFTDLEQVLGRQIDGFLPTGPQALLWHRYLNEVQMLFYTHPVNEARAQAQRQLIPSVWFWGGGFYPLLPQPLKRLQIYSDQPDIGWQAQALGYPTQQFSAIEQSHDESVWIISALSVALATGGIAKWQTALQDIEHTYLQVALNALKAQQIRCIELIFPEASNAYQVITHKRDTWKFWRPSPQQWIEKTLCL
jgi:hypothetical protein